MGEPPNLDPSAQGLVQRQRRFVRECQPAQVYPPPPTPVDDRSRNMWSPAYPPRPSPSCGHLGPQRDVLPSAGHLGQQRRRNRRSPHARQQHPRQSAGNSPSWAGSTVLAPGSSYAIGLTSC